MKFLIITTAFLAFIQSAAADNVCALPDDANKYSVVTTGDATIGAHSMYKGLAIAGTLYDGSPNESGTVDSTKSFVKSLDGNTNFNFNGGIQLGSSTVVDGMYERFAYLAQNAKDSQSGSYKVVVKSQGGTFNTYDFNAGGQGEDNGKTLVIFNTNQDVTLTKTPDSRQFGPTVIAPFAKVIVKGDAGFVDGSIYAKTLETQGGNQGGLQLHGDTYTGPIQCIDGPDDTNPTATTTTGAPLATTTNAPPVPPTESTPYCNYNNCDGIPAGGDWCNEEKERCTGPCNGQWCEAEPAAPATTTVAPPTESTPYCNYNNCDGNPAGGDWCNEEEARCTGPCNGQWCEAEPATPATTTVAPPATTTNAPPATTTSAPPATTTNAPPATTTNAPPAGGANGDPHVKTWDGSSFDFHGGCDLVLVKNTGFDNGKGLDIHIRTKIQTWWSFIETAAVRIGSDILEVRGGTNAASYWINGELKEHREFVKGESKSYREIGSLNGFKLEVKDVSDQQRNFRVKFGKGNSISLQAFREFIRVDVQGNSTNFAGSVGLMGEYPSGKKTDREGNVVYNTDEFGKEWQVRQTEVKLFHSVDGVQHPEECKMPVVSSDTARRGRRLGEGLVTEEEAAVACAHAHASERDHCIFDVLAINSKDMAGAY